MGISMPGVTYATHLKVDQEKQCLIMWSINLLPNMIFYESLGNNVEENVSWSNLTQSLIIFSVLPNKAKYSLGCSKDGGGIGSNGIDGAGMSLDLSNLGTRVHLPELEGAPSTCTQQEVASWHEVQCTHPVLVCSIHWLERLRKKGLQTETYCQGHMMCNDAVSWSNVAWLITLLGPDTQSMHSSVMFLTV